MDDTTPTPTSIPVTVDKSHLVTIGEKLYADKMDLVRELINNSYDADATEVSVTIGPHSVIVRDNGSGMDADGLRVYFTIGAQYKRKQPTSKRFGRNRIGEFGIGKFAVLSACKVFQIETQKGEFHTRLEFDKEHWSKTDTWDIHIEQLPHDPEFGQGTVVTLLEMNHEFSLTRLRRYLRERVPIQSPNFTVYINGEQLESEEWYGKKHSFRVRSQYGPVSGELILTNQPWKAQDAGIGIYVKGILISRHTFGLEMTKRFGATRLRGKLNADWLPITSNRDAFIEDSPEFHTFQEVVMKEIRKVLKVAKDLAHKRADQRSSQALKDALQKIGKALKQTEGLDLSQDIPLGERVKDADDGNDVAVGYDVSAAKTMASGNELPEELQERLKNHPEKKTKGRPTMTLGQKTIIRTLRFQNTAVAVRLEHLEDEEESLVDGGVVYINMDHPLYRQFHDDERLLSYHIARLITKELAASVQGQSVEAAFLLQSNLLTQAFRGKLKGK